MAWLELGTGQHSQRRVPCDPRAQLLPWVPSDGLGRLFGSAFPLMTLLRVRRERPEMAWVLREFPSIQFVGYTGQLNAWCMPGRFPQLSHCGSLLSSYRSESRHTISWHLTYLEICCSPLIFPADACSAVSDSAKGGLFIIRSAVKRTHMESSDQANRLTLPISGSNYAQI
jgi:hypothetical protein